VFPELFQTIILALLWGEQVYYHIAKIDHHPTLARLAFEAAVQAKFFFYGFLYSIGQAVQHPVTGAAGDDKIICEGSYFMNIQKENIFALFVF
jgi:hypothetical protein